MKFLFVPEPAAVFFKRVSSGLVAGLLGAALMPAHAATFALPPEGESLVGQLQETRVSAGETLLDVARRYGVGIDELAAANPGVDVWLPKEGARLIVPTQYLLPNTPREGIVVNLPELRLYYYPPAAANEARAVVTFPLGIGSEGRSMPVTFTKISEKKINPPWVVPETILAEHAAEGEILPRVVPPGPDNPLGEYSMRLGASTYLVHGTNRPFSVGMRVSHGCLRMYPEHIAELFPLVPLGAKVRVIDQPYKAGWYKGVLFVEAHAPMVEAGHSPDTNLTPMVNAVAEAASGYLDDASWQAASHIAQQGMGIPTPVFAGSPRPHEEKPGAAQIAAAERGWLVQVGVFRDVEKARRIVQRIGDLALTARASAVDDDRLCRVTVGPFANREEARRTGEKIRRDAGYASILVAAARVTERSAECAPDWSSASQASSAP